MHLDANDPSGALPPGPSDGTAAPSPLIVGIGGSAGALPAVLALLDTLGGDAAVAVVVVLHLSPDHESSAAEVLQRATPMKVTQVSKRTRLEAGHVYVIAPGMNLMTEDGHVQPSEGDTGRPSTVIDLYFRTLGEVHRENSVGIVLSGTGRDGSLGLSHIKECGGLTIAQLPEDAEYGDMPRAAIDTDAVDLVLTAAEIGTRLIDLAAFPRIARLPAAEPSDQALEERESPERAFQDILVALRIRMRHDFRHYKRATVLRRLERRVQVHGLRDLSAYRDYLRDHPDEMPLLLADMLISVTSFFRDQQAFEALDKRIVPDIMNRVAPGDEARIWIPACASGEESYSVAILLQEYADRMHNPPRIQIFASDINEAALSAARLGSYPANVVADISEPRLLGYFEREDGGGYRVRQSIRELVVFARHNVLGDPPFSRLDLICCRNLLIYLDRSAQAIVLEMFAYALKPGGYLFLGNAESIDASEGAFEPVSKEHRIYRLRAGGASHVRARFPSPTFDADEPAPTAPLVQMERAGARGRDKPLAAMHELALAAASPPSVLVNGELYIERVSPGAGRYIAFGEGIPSRNLLNNVAADIRLELRTAFFRAGETQARVQSTFRRAADASGQRSVMKLSVQPIGNPETGETFWLVLFDEQAESASYLPDSTATDNAAFEESVQRLEEENRSLKTHLQDTLDRSAVSNEELKASNEELQAINEELRSAKEELETSKEELQSVNEELTTVNYELRLKVDEAERHNDDLRNLMEASEIATVFVDPGMRVKRFTPQARKLFSLIATDIGRPLMDVKNRLRYDNIVEDATAAFEKLVPIERSVASIDECHYLARIQPYRTSQNKIGGAVLTFVDVTELRRAEHRVTVTEERLRDAISASRDFAVISTDEIGIITTWNEGAEATFGYTSAEILGQTIDRLFTTEDRAQGVPDQERRVALLEGRAADERWQLRRDGTTFFCSGVTTPLHTGSGRGFVTLARDVSASKIREVNQDASIETARRTAAELKASAELKDRFLAVMSHELKQPLNLIQVNAELLVRLPECRSIEAVQKIGGTLIRAVAAQETIVNDLLDFSRINTGKLQLRRQPTDLAEIVELLGKAAIPDAARNGITLVTEVADAVVCDGDPVRLEQVVWNLLSNARKFTPKGGQIRISVTSEGDEARLEVTDTGIGISKEFLPHIFELFSQDEIGPAYTSSHAGLGIGLALVRELVEAHGGRVRAASPGKGLGSTFTVWFPLTGSGRDETDGAEAPPRHLPRRILMVDDDLESMTSLAQVLELDGASVDAVTDPVDALRLLAAHTYDVVLSDISMGAMSGLDFMRRARELRPDNAFRSVAISGYGTAADVARTQAAGFDAHLSKPVSLARLREIMEGFGGSN
ncbi:ATP-binding protein [Luteimonas fraxinea]|uniref:histidine kinase n=1 Tax=Luteimonas fraxinea TaxID=2901869 RepID=A0ABS8UCV6_9GAMM|nr:CheR family methyltransferase [Luteimonas fraxinea]MCD9097303.1 ATP-binding protein [Luteimonas fraxinea]MCD9125132.1 ATP-binding protein [Luteimonas fraxinea]UHH11565.1 ATP-binding protein [Luteimonas fraxinea]